MASLDSNQDGKLSGAELNGLNAWADINEDGIAQSNELTALATALANVGLNSVRATDYAMYTAGNANFKTPAQPSAAAPVNTLTPPTMPTAPACNYRTLRDTYNPFISSQLLTRFKAGANDQQAHQAA